MADGKSIWHTGGFDDSAEGEKWQEIILIFPVSIKGKISFSLRFEYIIVNSEMITVTSVYLKCTPSNIEYDWTVVYFLFRREDDQRLLVFDQRLDHWTHLGL